MNRKLIDFRSSNNYTVLYKLVSSQGYANPSGGSRGGTQTSNWPRLKNGFYNFKIKKKEKTQGNEKK